MQDCDCLYGLIFLCHLSVPDSITCSYHDHCLEILPLTYLLKTGKGDAIKMNISQYTWDLTKKKNCGKYHAIHKRS